MKANPLNIQRYGSSKTNYTTFSGPIFTGWLCQSDKEWIAKPIGWKAHSFSSRGRAIRYIIVSTKK